MTPTRTQILTGHGGIAEYLHRFKLKDSPGCVCDPNISESIWHVLLECPRFEMQRTNLEIQLDDKLELANLHKILAGTASRPHFLSFAEKAFKTAAKRNATLQGDGATAQTWFPPQIAHVSSAPIPRLNTNERRILEWGARGAPGMRIRGVALFMESNREKLGISFCDAKPRKWVTISPGLASLMNGSTFKTSMRQRSYEELTEIKLADQTCKVLRVRNKTVLLFAGTDEVSPFSQACTVLSRLGEMSTAEGFPPTTISVDAMVIAFIKGEVMDHVGCIRASNHHEVIIYENRGEDLSFLQQHNPSRTGESIVEQREELHKNLQTKSGSEKLQERIALKRAQDQQRAAEQNRRSMSTMSELRAVTNAFMTVISQTPTRHRTYQNMRSSKRTHQNQRSDLPHSATQPTREQMGHVRAPTLRQAFEPLDHMINAFIEFLAIVEATGEVRLRTCKSIMHQFLLGFDALTDEKLKAEDALIYNNDTAEVIRGGSIRKCMGAYSQKGGFVYLDEEETERTGLIKFKTPQDDPVVVIARCTEIMLDDKILEMAKTIWRDGDGSMVSATWIIPKFTWTNGVPGCGKTTWIIENFRQETDIIVTSTKEAVRDLWAKLANRMGAAARANVRTMASVLRNGFRERERSRISRLIVDEALMNHFGAIVMAAQLAQANEVLLIGDINQLPFIDRNNLFPLAYCRPTSLTPITQNLRCTHRSPMDVVYALSEIYDGIYTSKPQVHSMRLERFSGAQIPKTQPNTLYLVHTQDEKASLTSLGYGKGEGSRMLTIHEAQGQTYPTVVIINTADKKIGLHDSIPHAVVAVSRHTNTCVYYTDIHDDAIAVHTWGCGLRVKKG
uniref:(+)RNA virus helicase C-terminal domain-containing protein n=1 Tax=Heliothis virescens TaxID=7102 RepID=A0A2A4JHJ8_HELVI